MLSTNLWHDLAILVIIIILFNFSCFRWKFGFKIGGWSGAIRRNANCWPTAVRGHKRCRPKTIRIRIWAIPKSNEPPVSIIWNRRRHRRRQTNWAPPVASMKSVEKLEQLTRKKNEMLSTCVVVPILIHRQCFFSLTIVFHVFVFSLRSIWMCHLNTKIVANVEWKNWGHHYPLWPNVNSSVEQRSLANRPPRATQVFLRQHISSIIQTTNWNR